MHIHILCTHVWVCFKGTNVFHSISPFLLPVSALPFSRSPLALSPSPFFPLLCDAFNWLVEYFISRVWMQIWRHVPDGHRCCRCLSIIHWLMHLTCFEFLYLISERWYAVCYFSIYFIYELTNMTILMAVLQCTSKNTMV